MKGYYNSPTQEQRILDLLKLRGKEGAGVWEFITPRNMGGLGIAQYTARISGLRQRGYEIISDPIGHYTLIKEAEPPKPPEQERIFE